MAWQPTHKPGFRVPMLDCRHELVRGLVLAAPFIEPSRPDCWLAFDVAARTPASRSNRTRISGGLGVGAGYSSTTNRTIEWPSRQQFDATAFTAAAIVGYGSTRGMASRIITRGDAQPWSILERVANGQGTAVGRIVFADGDSREASVATGVRYQGDAALAVLRVDAAGQRMTLDWFCTASGHQQDVQTWSLTKTLAASTEKLGLGDLPGTGGSIHSGWRGPVYAGWFWQRWISDSDVCGLARDPFAMFRLDPARNLPLIAALGTTTQGWRRRFWGAGSAYAAPAAMRPGGTIDGYGWA